MGGPPPQTVNVGDIERGRATCPTCGAHRVGYLNAKGRKTLGHCHTVFTFADCAACGALFAFRHRRLIPHEHTTAAKAKPKGKKKQ